MKTYIHTRLRIAMLVLLLIGGVSSVSFADGTCCESKTAATAEGGQCSSCKMHSSEEQSHDGAKADGGEHAGHGAGHGSGGQDQGAEGQGHGGGRNMAVMQGAHTLVNGHASIERKVEEIPGGVRTVTTTKNPELVAVLQKHPREMGEHLENGGHVRKWDPLFSELAKYQDKIEMTYKNIENGIEVSSTSKDKAVTALIRAHAKKVSEFVARGHAAMRESTPLPEGYEAPEQSTHQH